MWAFGFVGFILFIAFIFVLPLFVRTFCSFVRSATSYQCITILRCIAIRFITWHVNLLLPLPVHSLICSFFNPFDIFDYLFTCSLVLSSPCLIGSFTCWLVCSSLHSFFSSVRSLAPLMLHVCKRRKLLPAMGNTAKASECLAGYSPASTAYAGLFCQNLANRAGLMLKCLIKWYYMELHGVWSVFPQVLAQLVAKQFFHFLQDDSSRW